MNLSYLSAPHILMIAVAVCFVAGVCLLLRGRSDGTKRAVLFAFALLNLVQHLLKSFVWPHMWGTGFSSSNTAYNVCAILIYLTPIAYCCKLDLLRDTVLYIGTIGPSLTLCIPYWFQGQPFLQWEVLRFFVCHVLLILTSLAPLLVGLHRPSFARAPLIPLAFFAMLAAILLNDTLCCLTGLIPSDNIFQTLSDLNPCWSMRPAAPENFQWAADLLESLSPSFLLGNETRPYVPILWFFIPIYLGLFFLTGLSGLLFDRAAWKRQAHREDCKPFKKYVSCRAFVVRPFRFS